MGSAIWRTQAFFLCSDHSKTKIINISPRLSRACASPGLSFKELLGYIGQEWVLSLKPGERVTALGAVVSPRVHHKAASHPPVWDVWRHTHLQAGAP